MIVNAVAFAARHLVNAIWAIGGFTAWCLTLVALYVFVRSPQHRYTYWLVTKHVVVVTARFLWNRIHSVRDASDDGGEGESDSGGSDSDSDSDDSLPDLVPNTSATSEAAALHRRHHSSSSARCNSSEA